MRNAAASGFGQILSFLMRFLCRTAFLHTLGREYLGIASLYTNVLTLLSITELGFGAAVTYSLYDPLARGDEAKVRSLMQFYRRAYQFIGGMIFCVGLLLIPVLPRLMTGVTDKVNIYLYYILYLIQTTVSYLFFAYKSTLLIADQKKYIYDIHVYIVMILENLVQIAILVFWGSYFAYTLVLIVSNIATNLWVARTVDKRYPYLLERAEPLAEADRKGVFSRVYAMALYKIAGAVGTSTDNIIISAMIGVVEVGLYNNYYMIISMVQSFVTGFFRSFSASLGNLYAEEGEERNEFMFRTMSMISNCVVTMCAILFMVLFQPFIRIWAGRDYLLPFPVVALIVFNFFTNYLTSTVQIFRETTGVFVRGKYRAAATAVLNLVLSILFVRWWGFPGVFLGSVVSRMLTTWWYDPYLVYHDALHRSPWPFFRDGAVMTGILVLVSGATILAVRPLVERPLLCLMASGVMAGVLGAGLLFLLYFRSEEFSFVLDKLHLRRSVKKGL